METTLRDLELVEALVAHGTMTAAAEHLYVSQPALSQRLTNLERRLNSQLFMRSSHGLEPTSDGWLLLSSARTALEAVRDAEFQIQARTTGQRTIRLMSQCTNNYSWLPKALTTVRKKFTNLVVEVEAVDDDQIVGCIVDGGLDLAIVSKLRQDMDQLKLQTIFDDELVAVVSAAHPWAKKSYISAPDFADQHLVLCDNYDQTRQPAAPLPLPVGATPGKLSTPPVTNDLCIQMVSFGDSVTVMPGWVVAPYLEGLDVVARPMGDPPGVTRTWYAATKHGATDEMIDGLVDSIRSAATNR